MGFGPILVSGMPLGTGGRVVSNSDSEGAGWSLHRGQGVSSRGMRHGMCRPDANRARPISVSACPGHSKPNGHGRHCPQMRARFDAKSSKSRSARTQRSFARARGRGPGAGRLAPAAVQILSVVCAGMCGHMPLSIASARGWCRHGRGIPLLRGRGLFCCLLCWSIVSFVALWPT